jgi:hypothetical protein
LAGEPPRSTTGSADDTNASFLEDIEHAEQNEAVMANDVMDGRVCSAEYQGIELESAIDAIQRDILRGPEVL